jgi:hypothetical protein
MTVPYTFGNESSPIPLSQLDANFAATPNYANTAGNVTNAAQTNITSVGTLTALSVSGNVNGGNLRTTGSVSATGNIAAANVTTGGSISAFGAVTGGSLTIAGIVNATGTITSGNVLTGGLVSATGNISSGGNLSAGGNLSVGGNISSTGQISAQGNVLAQGIVSAVGNIVTAQYFVGNFLGNITGNISVGGSNTQVLFNSNGNVGAAGGLTYNSGSNTLGVLGVVSVQGNIFGANLVLSGTGNLTAGGNINVGANLVVSGITQLVGAATAPTAPTGTANNQVATTAFVINNGVPSGCILLWSGSIISIPSGWYLCDGTNSTPDLRNRFIVGAGSTYNVAATGGSTDAVVVSHTHTATVTDPAHAHTISPAYFGASSPNGFAGAGGAGQVYGATQAAVTGITVGISTTGSSGTNANLPPYYALAYIMKA